MKKQIKNLYKNISNLFRSKNKNYRVDVEQQILLLELSLEHKRYTHTKLEELRKRTLTRLHEIKDSTTIYTSDNRSKLKEVQCLMGAYMQQYSTYRQEEAQIANDAAIDYHAAALQQEANPTYEEKIANLLNKGTDLRSLTYKEIGSLIGITNISTVRVTLSRMIKNKKLDANIIKRNRRTK